MTRRRGPVGNSGSCVFCSGPGSVVLDCGRILESGVPSGVIPGCLVFEIGGKPHVGVVEPKGKRHGPGHAIAQLEAGKAPASKTMSDLGIKSYEICLIMVAPGHPGSALKARRAVQRPMSVRHSTIITARRGDTFSKARRPRLRR